MGPLARFGIGLLVLLAVIVAGVHAIEAAVAGDPVGPLPFLVGLVAIVWSSWGTGSWTTHRFGTLRSRWQLARRPPVDVDDLDADGSGDLVIEGDLAALFEPGFVVYRHYDRDGVCLYVGQTDSMSRRTRQHMRGQPWSGQVARTVMNRYATKGDMLVAERAQIRLHRPVHNVVRYGAGR